MADELDVSDRSTIQTHRMLVVAIRILTMGYMISTVYTRYLEMMLEIGGEMNWLEKDPLHSWMGIMYLCCEISMATFDYLEDAFYSIWRGQFSISQKEGMKFRTILYWGNSK